MKRVAIDDPCPITTTTEAAKESVVNGEMHASISNTDNHLAVPLFPLAMQDVELLAQSDGFTLLRNHLAQHYDSE